MPRFEHRAIPVVLAAILIDTIGFGIIMPVLPQLIGELGHTDMESATRIAGWLLVVFAIGQFLAAPILGSLGDRYGRRPVLIIAMVAFAIDYGLMAFAPSLPWLFLGRVIAGAAGAVNAPASAAIADVTTPERRSASFGLLGAAFGVGFILGPALGGLMGGFGSRAPFLLAAGFAAVNALTMVLFLPETLRSENRRRFRWRDANVIGSFRPLFHAGKAAPLLVAWLLWQLASQVYPSIWSFWATIRFGWTPGEIGWSLAYVGLMTVLVQAFITPTAVRRLGERNAAVLGMLCGTVTLVVYAFVTQGWQVYAFFLVGALAGISYPAFTGIASRRVGASHQGGLQGGLSSLNSMAAIFGPLIAAQSLAYGVARGFDGAAFLLAALLLIGALGIVVVFVPRAVPGSADEAADRPDPG